MRFVLDTSILGMVVHPRKHRNVQLWFRGIIGVLKHEVLYAPLVDYELRRELLRLGSTASLRQLDALRARFPALPLDEATLDVAADLWAQLRRKGLPTAVEEALDVDVILAAQALRAQATVVTENARHLGRLVTVARWHDL